MRKLFMIVATLLALGASVTPSLADSKVGLLVAPKQAIGSTFASPATDVGATYQLTQLGPVAIDALAINNDTTGIHYGAFASVPVYKAVSVGVGSTYNFGSKTVAKPFFGLEVRI